MKRCTVAAVAVCLAFLTSCTSSTSSSTTTTTATAWDCTLPPDSELDATSPFPLSVEPTGAQPGSTVTLHVGGMPGVENRHGTSPQLYWQCWNGSGWVNTHQITRDGPTIDITPGATVTSPGSLIFVPDDFQITIPEVEPGWYRIEDFLSVEGRPTGHAMIEILAPDR